MLTPTHESQNVAPEQHLHPANATLGELCVAPWQVSWCTRRCLKRAWCHMKRTSSEGLLERVNIVNAKTSVSPTGEAACAEWRKARSSARLALGAAAALGFHAARAASLAGPASPWSWLKPTNSSSFLSSLLRSIVGALNRVQQVPSQAAQPARRSRRVSAQFTAALHHAASCRWRLSAIVPHLESPNNQG